MGGQNGSGFGQNGQQQTGRGAGATRSGGRGSLLIIVIVLILLLGGGGKLSGLFGSSVSGSSSYSSTYPSSSSSGSSSYSASSGSSSTGSSASSYADLLPGMGSLFSGSTGSSTVSSSSAGWGLSSNSGTLDRSVSPEARDKFTTIRGNGKDQVTVMVYLCGTDLESRSAMATKDLNEMLGATISSKVNVLVYTGGCSQWRNNVISSSVNQIY